MPVRQKNIKIPVGKPNKGNPVAKSLMDRQYRQRKVPSSKVYNRKQKEQQMVDTIFSIGVGVVIAVIVLDYTAIMVVRVWRLLQSTADTLYGK